jgi:ribose 5-phosphate isomerase B
MRIAIGNDHAGFQLKEFLKPRLEKAGFEVVDCGCYSTEQVDFPEFTLKVVWEIVSGHCERGIYTCGNGYAMAMLANRVPGMRAATCHDVFTAHSSKEMGDSNIISIGARVVGPEVAWDLAQLWLKSEFLGKTVPRYARRLEEVAAFDQLFARADWKQRLEDYVKELPKRHE